MSLAQPMHFLEKRTTLFPGLIPKVNFHGTLVSLLECNEGRYEKRVECPLRLPPSVLHHLSSSFLHSATLPGVIYMKDDLSPDPNKHNACSMHREKITSASLLIVAPSLLIPLFLSSSLGFTWASLQVTVMYGWTGTCLSHYFLKSLSMWKMQWQ